jgi:hypothetical protein
VKRHILILCTLLLAFIVLSNYAYSSAYVGTQDKQLHYDLQTLVEWGYLDMAITTYPVPWKGISKGINELNPEGMAFRPRQAYMRLSHYLTIHKRGTSRKYLTLQGASDDVRLRSFDDGAEDTAKATISSEFYYERISGQVSVNYASGGRKNYDNSFVAYQFGDWNLRAGSIDQWWGPGQSSSLIMSNNSRPIKALALSRSTNTQSNSPWLAWMGPWYLTTQIGQLEKYRTVPNAKILMNRFNARPLKGLEVGLSWTTMWGGKGQSESVQTFYDVLTFKGACDLPSGDCTNPENNSKQGNYLAGIDLTYTAHFFERPWTFYVQRIGEDVASGYEVNDNANLFGVSTYWKGAKLFIESSDTNIACGNDGSATTNCFYENANYPDGYRMYGRTFGSTFDSDAKQLTLGANMRFVGGDMAEIYVRSAELNSDGIKPSPLLTRGVSEDLLEVSGFYQKPIGNWLLKAGGSITNRKFATVKDEVDAVMYLKAQFAF